MGPLDRWLPSYEVREHHQLELTASPEDALAAALALPVGSDRVTAALLRLRGLPAGGNTIEGFFSVLGFEVLERDERSFVVGASGRPWRPAAHLRPLTAAESGDVGMVADLRAVPAPRGCVLSTETRVDCVGAGARRAFRTYWLVVGPFSALIRRRWLAAVARALAHG